MVLELFLLLLLPIAAFSGWAVARYSHTKSNNDVNTLPSQYIDGLNFLLNEQPDKAVDVFIEMLAVNSDTVETHLALGSLFRRRGEVDRAIRIHQNIIARPNLKRHQRATALFELGEDYMTAGFLDRAEALFLELVGMGEYKLQSLTHLRSIYHQQHDWEKAIQIANKTQVLTGQTMAREIAHYHCELADIAKQEGRLDTMGRFIKTALFVNPSSVRAMIQQAELYVALGRYKQAIKVYQQVVESHSVYMAEVFAPLAECYEIQGNGKVFAAYLKDYIAREPRFLIISPPLSKQLRRYQGDDKAIDLMKNYLHDAPSVQGIKALLDIYVSKLDASQGDFCHVLQELIDKVVYSNPTYQCVRCGFSCKILYWFCPSCKHWDTVRPMHGLSAHDVTEHNKVFPVV